jgi:hypothetical protein
MAAVRRAGVPQFRSGARPSSTPYSAFNSGTAGEVRINSNQMLAIEHLYNSSPSIQAARAILVGQLLSSGLSLTRSGEAVKLTGTFSKHLESVWMPFTRIVVDSILKFGFCVVSIEEEAPPPFSAFTSARDGEPEPKRTKGVGAPQTDGNSTDGTKVVRDAPKPDRAKNLVPVVPTMLSYEVALVPGGRCGYDRTPHIFTTAPAHAYVEDKYSAIFFRTWPDHNGNLVSPVAAAFEHVSFVNALRELALSAEVVRATPTLVTQSAPRVAAPGAGGVDPSNLFFDAESRSIQQSSADSEAAERTQQLALTAKLAQELNRVRTTNPDPTAVNSAPPPPLPPEVPPRLFALPERQVLVPNALQPNARTDLEALMRAANESIACAMGVPASVIFEGKFSANSMSQLQLLNTTVSSISLAVNEVLTKTYHAIYGGSDDTELVLRTAPLAATAEVQSLYQAQIIDYESAMPAALHSLGCSSEEIDAALERRRKAEAAAEKKQKEVDKVESSELALRKRVAEKDDGTRTPDKQDKKPGGGGSAPSKPQSDAGD